jgi:DNA-directed RNA polymerase specialized sigma24 family protein
VVQSGSRWNFSEAVQQLVDELPEVLARPLSLPVHAQIQGQSRLEQHEVQELVAGYRAGASMKELAKRHGIHRTTVAHWLHENAVELRRQGIASEQIQEVTQLYAEGWSLARLGDRFECDAETVRSVLRAAHVVLRRPWERLP